MEAVIWNYYFLIAFYWLYVSYKFVTNVINVTIYIPRGECTHIYAMDKDYVPRGTDKDHVPNETWSKYRSARKNTRRFSTRPTSYILFLMSSRTSSLFHRYRRLLFLFVRTRSALRPTATWAKLSKPRVNSFETVALNGIAPCRILSYFFYVCHKFEKNAQDKTFAIFTLHDFLHLHMLLPWWCYKVH